MHADRAEVMKSVRTYFTVGALLLLFTVITVAANQVHLAVPAAITVAIVIACLKGSMVAAVFMHLSHEKKWIYGALVLAAVLFIFLLFVPLFTTMNTFGVRVTTPAAAQGEAARPGH